MEYNFITDIIIFESSNDFYRFFSESKDYLNYFIFEKVKFLIKNKLEKIQVLHINDDEPIDIFIKKSEILDTLEKLISKFEQSEEYETCAECLELINLIKNEM
jgi:hypothetical protein